MVAPLPISPRQREILNVLELGRTDKEIAAELGVSYRTIRTHLELLYRRFGVSTRTALVTTVRAAGSEVTRREGGGTRR